MFRRRRVVVLAAIVPLLGGCLFTPGPWTRPVSPTGHRVAVVGDSITVEAEEGVAFDPTQHVLTDDLTRHGDGASVDAAIGADTNDLFKKPFTSAPFPAPGPDILVMALGTNDAHPPRLNGTFVGTAPQVPLSQSKSNLETYLASSPATCVILVNVYTNVRSWSLDVNGPLYNQMLDAISANSSGRVRVADWNALATRHPEWLSHGGPHLTTTGVSAYRGLIELSVAACASTTSTSR
jgi:GDSL-like Lipase/Acylhydrolase family